MIRHNRPLIKEQDILAVENVLRSGWIAHGDQVTALENDFNFLYGGGGACACSSGTAALYLAFKGLGIGPNKRIAIPTYACSALLNAIYMAGAVPVVVDVREDDFTINADNIDSKVEAVVAVHTYGAKADISLLKRKAPLIVEDCCQSLGGSNKDGKLLGLEGHVAIFSFYATKIITCGHGGMIWDVYDEVASITRDLRDFDCRKNYKPRFNFHLTDFQAAMARPQLSRLGEIAEKRRKIARKYLSEIPENVHVQKGISDQGRMVYRFVLRFSDQKIRDEAIEHFKIKGIQTIIPIERYELLHRYLNLDPEGYPIAERLVDTTLSIPIYPALNDDEVEKICDALSEVQNQ